MGNLCTKGAPEARPQDKRPVIDDANLSRVEKKIKKHKDMFFEMLKITVKENERKHNDLERLIQELREQTERKHDDVERLIQELRDTSEKSCIYQERFLHELRGHVTALNSKTEELTRHNNILETSLSAIISSTPSLEEMFIKRDRERLP